MTDLSIDDDTLEGVVGCLVRAAHEMCSGNAPRPESGFDSLTGVSDEVERFMRGLHVGRAALADAAKTAAQAASGLMRSAEALDAGLAASLHTGFAVQRTRR